MNWSLKVIAFVLSLGLMGSLTAFAQGITVSGNVKDEAGEPLIGVSVLQSGTLNGTMTDLDGNYTFKLGQGPASLTFSYIGFAEQTVEVGKSNVVNVVLKADAQRLDDVVVIGYGTARKKDLTGAISSINAEDLKVAAPRTVEDLMRGNTAGVGIEMSNTAKGQAPIQVRGETSLKAIGSPLIVLDGVIYSGELADINPNDIERIDILKDASSAAIYGTRASNGVIAISTRKGNLSSKPTINFNANTGIAVAANIPEVYGPEGYLKYREDLQLRLNGATAEKNPQYFTNPANLSGVSALDWYNYSASTPATTVPSAEELTRTWLKRLDLKDPEIANYFAGNITDWEKETFRPALLQDYTASISKKNDDMSYYWSIGYTDREGIAYGDEFQAFRTKLNFETKVTNFLTVGINGNFAMKDQSAIAVGIHDGFSPYMSNDIDDPDSAYRQYPSGHTTPQSGFYVREMKDQLNKYYTVNANVFAKVKLPFAIEYQFNFTPYMMFHEKFYHESAAWDRAQQKDGYAQRTNDHTYNWSIDNIFTWKKEFGKNKIDATFVYNAEKNQSWQTTATGYGFTPSDGLSYHRINNGTTQTVSSVDTYDTGDAMMGRVQYQYDGKYFLSASIRRDGYSAFGANCKRAWFPSVSAAWVFTKEPFFANSSWLTYGKLRFSWGENGNRSIGRYAALPLLKTAKYAHMLSDGTIENISRYTLGMVNNDLKWERTGAYNLGLDFGILEDVLTGSIEAYTGTTTDLLTSMSLPDIIGTSSVTTNIGSLRNRGIEVTLNSTIMNRPNFKWNAGLTFSMNRREIVSLYGDMEDILDEKGNVIGQKEKDDVDNNWFIGEDPDRYYTWEYDGIWQTNEAEEAAKYGMAPGDFHVIDQNKDGILDASDKVHLGYKTPRSRWTFRTNFTLWKNFDIAASFYANIGHSQEFAFAWVYNEPNHKNHFVANYWTPENPTNDAPRIQWTNNLAGFTPIMNASFIRFDNLSFSYRVPNTFTQKAKIRDMRISLSCRNVGVWAPYYLKGWFDPELNEAADDTHTNGYNSRTFNLGVNFSF